VKTLETLHPLITRLQEIAHLKSAASVLSWDRETYMPAGGGAARADQIATVESLAHAKLVSSAVEELLLQWVDPATGQARDQPGDSWDEPSRALLREAWRDFSRAKKLPPELVTRLSRECSLAQQVWVEARKKSDVKLFLPNLRMMKCPRMGSGLDFVIWQLGEILAGTRRVDELSKTRPDPIRIREDPPLGPDLHGRSTHPPRDRQPAQPGAVPVVPGAAIRRAVCALDRTRSGASGQLLPEPMSVSAWIERRQQETPLPER